MIKSQRMRWAAYMGHNRSSKKILLEKLEGKRSLGSSRCRWQQNTEKNLKETACRASHRVHGPPDKFSVRVLQTFSVHRSFPIIRNTDSTIPYFLVNFTCKQ
jgi:hypothetical protein